MSDRRIFSTTTIAWCILIFTFFPFLMLCAFNVPLGDDFWYANAFRENGMLETQRIWYQEWSGRYMATFLISTVNPASYGYLNLAFAHPLILLLGTVFCLRYFVNTVVHYFEIPVNKILLLSILLFFYMNYLPDVGESFYWMAGAYTYQVPVLFFFLYLALMVHAYFSTSAKGAFGYLLLGVFCLFLILGSNEVIVVYTCALNGLIAVVLAFLKREKFFRFLPVFGVTIVLAVSMIFAEGNFARSELFEKPSFHFLKSSIHALSRGLFVLSFWIPTLVLLLLMVPGLSNTKTPSNPIRLLQASRGQTFIGAAAIFFLAITFIGFFPSIYATRWIPQRAYTPIFMVFLIGFAVVFVFMLRNFPVLSRLNSIFSAHPKNHFVFLAVLIVALSHNSNVMNAYVDLTSGKASAYHAQVMKTYKELETTSKDTVYVNELAKKPLILPIRWPHKHNRLANSIWEDYFGVDKVEVE